MTFISYEFIGFVFILIFLYFILPLQVRCYILLIGSLFFYYQSGLRGMVFLGASGCLTYISGLIIGVLRDSFTFGKDGETPKQAAGEDRKESAFAVLVISLLFLIAMLMCSKIGNHLTRVFDKVFKGEPVTISAIVPLGISYYTLAAIGYLADVYWKKDQPEKNPFKLMLYLCYFPQILQGPIPKHKKLAPQLCEGHRFDYNRFCFGLQRAIWGFFKKLVIADRLALMVNQVFDNYQSYNGLVLSQLPE